MLQIVQTRIRSLSLNLNRFATVQALHSLGATVFALSAGAITWFGTRAIWLTENPGMFFMALAMHVASCLKPRFEKAPEGLDNLPGIVSLFSPCWLMMVAAIAAPTWWIMSAIPATAAIVVLYKWRKSGI